MTSYCKSSRITTGPWYECRGPDAEEVRKDHFRKYINTIKFKPYKLTKILLKHIPDTMNNFGSYRGYASFGLDNYIKKNIHYDIILETDKLKNTTVEKIKKWYFENKYRPDGIGYKKTEEHFAKMVAKN